MGARTQGPGLPAGWVASWESEGLGVGEPPDQALPVRTWEGPHGDSGRSLSLLQAPPCPPPQQKALLSGLPSPSTALPHHSRGQGAGGGDMAGKEAPVNPGGCPSQDLGPSLRASPHLGESGPGGWWGEPARLDTRAPQDWQEEGPGSCSHTGVPQAAPPQAVLEPHHSGRFRCFVFLCVKNIDFQYCSHQTLKPHRALCTHTLW